jgi:hypothetical protein
MRNLNLRAGNFNFEPKKYLQKITDTLIGELLGNLVVPLIPHSFLA